MINNNQNLAFRSISPSDLPLINRLMRAGKGYWGYEEEGLDRFMKIFAISDEAYFDKTFGSIMEFPQEIIGYYLFKIHEKELELDHFFLDTQFIGQGYGRYLWEHCIEAAYQKGWNTFFFSSDPHSRGFYERMGAVQSGEKPSILLPNDMTPIMQFTIMNRNVCMR